MTDAQRRKVGREVKSSMSIGDIIYTRTDGRWALGEVDTIGHKVRIRWLSYVPTIDGHRRKLIAIDPARFVQDEALSGCKWRLMPLDREGA